MNATQPALDLTVTAEGDKLVSYPDPKGIWTIGRGNIWMPNGQRVKEGDTITQEEDNLLFAKACADRDKQVSEAIPNVTDQNKFNACWMFVYNEGIGQFLSSTLHKEIIANQNDIDIPNHFMRWIYGEVNGKEVVLDGLVKRRGNEIAMWLNCQLSEVRSKWTLLDEVLKKEELKNLHV